MATIAPPPSKRQRREELARSQVQQDVTAAISKDLGSFKARFVDSDGNQMADVIEIPVADATEKNVSLLLNTLLGRDQEEHTPYRFRIHVPTPGGVIDAYPTDPAGLIALLQSHGIADPFETTITLAAEPQAVFRVQAVSRLAHRIPGHGQPVLAAQWHPRPGSARLATGSGDCTARIWDADTGTPSRTLSGHGGWVLGVAWSPDGERLATCSMDKTVRVWDDLGVTGDVVAGKEARESKSEEKGDGKGEGKGSGKSGGKGISSKFTVLSGHAKWVLGLAWEPYHLWRDGTPRLASASKDGTVRVWVVNTGRTEHVLGGHKGSVSCVRWGAGGGGTDGGGAGLIYSGSHDKTVRVWDAARGTLVHTLASHAHWVNHLALSTDFALRTSFFEYGSSSSAAAAATDQEKRDRARDKFEKAAKIRGKVAERVVSASDDFTMYLWDPAHEGNKPVARLLGHQKQVNHVTFSPDGTLIASAGWDNHTKLWNARDGKFINTLRGHVGPVYQCSFSADGRLLVTASKDTTLKVWNVRTCKLATDLPGHQDEVYAVDWSPDGRMVGSGGKDKAVRLWRN